MLCPSCDQRKARRECPALAKTICPTCCGTKRLTDIACPSDCRYLSTARAHPASVVKRQRERDVAVVLPTIRHLSERQYQLFFLVQSVIARHKPRGLTSLVDSDIAEAAGALAATLEAAGRGIIYEQAPQGGPAQVLVAEIEAALAQMRSQGATIYDGETAIVLRAIERGATEIKAPGDGAAAYAALIARLLQASAVPPSSTEPASGNAGALIMP
jgi:hypothetical protein